MGTCPWDGFEPAAVHFCEQELCAWIEQPANTWSNLFYVIVGVVIVALAWRQGRKPLVAIGLIEIAVGFGSALFHASSTHVGEVVDIGCMYLFALYALLTNVQRRQVAVGRPWSLQRLVFLYIALSATSIVAVALLGGVVGIVLFAVQVILAGNLEHRIYRSHRPDGLSYRPLVYLLLCFSCAWAAWWFDLLKINCDPDNHVLQGHAVWHALNAFCFLFLYRFYRQTAAFLGKQDIP